MKRLLWMILVMAALFMPLCASAQVTWQDPGAAVEVHSVTLQGEEWLFLPSGSDLSALKLIHNGEAGFVNWLEVSHENEVMPNVRTGTWNGETLHVMVSEHLRSFHLQSSDPDAQGRLWLEDSLYHEHSTTARLVILDCHGVSSHSLNIAELRGRGNSSWRMASRRRPYQFKLEHRADLLQTGLREEYCSTWVLLTNDDDYSLLRNQLGLDIAKELGLEDTSRCEQVDLYYDGDYRGNYLLAEKLEVAEHGVDVTDFDKLLKPVNDLLRVPDPDLLPNPLVTGWPASTGSSEYGAYAIAPGVYDNQDVDAGGYLLELDSISTMSENAWFALPDGRYIAIKNPEYIGESMMRHVQEIFFKAYDAMLNHGYHPETGEALETLIDIDSFTRSHLVQELLRSSNGYYFSSTFFVLPQGETRLYAGPVWDFDHGVDTPSPGLRDNNALSRAFYRTTVFQRAAKALCEQEIRPMYQNILFGQEHGRYLESFSTYRDRLNLSWQMNYYRFYADVYGYSHADDRFESTMRSLADFLLEQSEFLFEEIAAWGEDEPTHEVEIFFELPYASASDPTVCEMFGEQYGSLLLDTQFVNVQPATREERGVWQVIFTIRPKPHCTVPEDLVVLINGEKYSASIQDNTAVLVFEYEDWYYRPAVVDGVDYGTVFDYDIYTDIYPELLDEGYSYEDVIRHFRDVGMVEGVAANDYFDPLMIFDALYEVCEMLGDDWPRYYQEYLDDYLPWTQEMYFVYEPEWVQIEN